jgi:hypothetical protein
LQEARAGGWQHLLPLAKLQDLNLSWCNLIAVPGQLAVLMALDRLDLSGSYWLANGWQICQIFQLLPPFDLLAPISACARRPCTATLFPALPSRTPPCPAPVEPCACFAAINTGTLFNKPAQVAWPVVWSYDARESSMEATQASHCVTTGGVCPAQQPPSPKDSSSHAVEAQAGFGQLPLLSACCRGMRFEAPCWFVGNLLHRGQLSPPAAPERVNHPHIHTKSTYHTNTPHTQTQGCAAGQHTVPLSSAHWLQRIHQ